MDPFIRALAPSLIFSGGVHMAGQTDAFEALHIPANDTPWFPYGQSGCEVQLIQADPTTGQWIARLRGPAGAISAFTAITAPCLASPSAVRGGIWNTSGS